MKKKLLNDNRLNNFVSIKWSIIKKNSFNKCSIKFGKFKLINNFSIVYQLLCKFYRIIKKVQRKKSKCIHFFVAILLLIILYISYFDNYLNIDKHDNYFSIYYINDMTTNKQKIDNNILFKNNIQINSLPKYENKLLNSLTYKKQSLLKTDVSKQSLESFFSPSPTYFSISLNPSLNTSFKFLSKPLKKTFINVKTDHLQGQQIKKFAFTNHSSSRKESLLEKQLSWYELLGITLFNLFGNFNSPSKQTSLKNINKQSILKVKHQNSLKNTISLLKEKHNKKQKQRLPQCIIIGVRKAGTRAVLEYLSLNNHIRKADNEIHFFDNQDHYELGLEFYRKIMPFSNKDQITIEKSPAYFVTNGVPERIKAMNASIKLILIVRDPVVRLISDYTQLAHNKMLKLNDAIVTSKPIISNIYKGNFYSSSNNTQINYIPNNFDSIYITDDSPEISQLNKNDYWKKKSNLQNSNQKTSFYENKFIVNSIYSKHNTKNLFFYPINILNNQRKLFKFYNLNNNDTIYKKYAENKINKFNPYFQSKIYYKNSDDNDQIEDDIDLYNLNDFFDDSKKIQQLKKKSTSLNFNLINKLKKIYFSNPFVSESNLNTNEIYEQIPKFEKLVIKNGEVNINYKPVRTSIYSLYMDDWLKIFKRDQIHIVDGDMLVKDPYSELHKIEKFLNIPHEIKRDQFVFNKKKNFYCARIQLNLNNQFLSKKKFKIHRLFKKFGEKQSAIRCLNTSKGRKHPQVNESVISKLREFYAPFNHHFYRMVNMRFDWLEV